MDAEDKQQIIKARSRAASKARQRLAQIHYAEYDRYYREECLRQGLTNRQTKAERIAALRAEIAKLEEVVEDA